MQKFDLYQSNTKSYVYVAWVFFFQDGSIQKYTKWWGREKWAKDDLHGSYRITYQTRRAAQLFGYWAQSAKSGAIKKFQNTLANYRETERDREGKRMRGREGRKGGEKGGGRKRKRTINMASRYKKNEQEI